jgi:hypothetical protein
MDIRRASSPRLAFQHHAEKTPLNRQSGVVVDKTLRPELVHEVIDPRPDGADCLGDITLADTRNYSSGSAILLVSVRPGRLSKAD